MTLTRPNALIAAGIALVNAIIPFLVLISVLSWDGEQVASAMGIVSLAGTFIGLLFASTPATNTPADDGEHGGIDLTTVVVLVVLLVIVLVLVGRL